LEEGERQRDDSMAQKCRILIAEDYTILREGLRSLLSSNPEFEITGEAEDGNQAVQQTEKLKPDVVLMDLSMPRMNGMEAIREAKKRCPGTKILALTVHKDEEYIRATLAAGADGYVLKDATHAELVMAIKSVLAGKYYLSPGVSEKIIEGYLEGGKVLKPLSAWETLTQREREVLKLIGEGYKSKEIAEYLCISVKTVDKHRANLMQKLDLHNVQGLTAYAIERGLVNK
jgi:two-component system, NarL family, response regulator NreC